MDIIDALNALLPDVDADDGEHATREHLRTRIMVLSHRAWENRVNWELVERWLDNFDGRSGLSIEVERLHALYILSQFLYFGSTEIRVLLRATYRDLFLIPLIQEIRAELGGERDHDIVRAATAQALSRTRFLGVGNPSESGVHLLYFFRQENFLSKQHFLDTAQIIEVHDGKRQLQYPDVDRYVFVDDVCGSGETAEKYSKNFLTEVLRLSPRAKLSYLAMFGTTEGLDRIRQHTVFGDRTAAIYELDETYKCLGSASRYLSVVPPHIEPMLVRLVARHYGEILWPGYPSGYLDGELLLGFHHNTPDNTLPIVWMDPTHNPSIQWTPAFRRYPKI